MALTKLNFTGQPTLPSASMPTGSVIQTVYVPVTDFGAMAGVDVPTNFTALPNFEASITRTINSSKIMVITDFAGSSLNGTRFQLQRKIGSGSYTEVYVGTTGTQNERTSTDQVFSTIYGSSSVNGNYYAVNRMHSSFVDNPTSGSDAITYRLTYANHAAGHDFRFNTDGSNDTTNYSRVAMSSFTLQEIKG